MVAPGTTAPDASVMLPEIVAVPSWADAGVQVRPTAAAKMIAARKTGAT
jgi:hypothetical protein